MRLSEKSVSRPVTTLMVFFAVLLFGLVAIRELPRDVLPDIEFPTLTIVTAYPGASAELVEEQVTEPLETVLAATENLRTIESSSSENVSFITLRFDWGANVNEASNNARDMIELARRHLPRDAHQPVILKVNSSMIPVLAYGIQAKEHFYELDDIIEEEVASPLRRVEGVGTVVNIGAPRREIRIEADPVKLRAYNTSVNHIATILKAENISIPGGNIEVSSRDFSVSTTGEFNDVAEIEDIVLSHINNKVVKIKDVATVVDDFEERHSYARTEGRRSVAFFVQKQTGTNTLAVADAVREEMSVINQNLPDDVEVIELIDSSDIVTHSISNLSNTLWWAGLFVILVVYLFLRRWKSSLIIMLTMPVSLIVAFIFMFMAGYSINIFSLMAVVIAIGMVVDNAIVVLENITRHIEKGSGVREAAVKGASEIGTAISASTLTTISVFLPLLFLGGVVGILFRQLAVLTTITLIASLVTALTLTPMLSSRLIPKAGSKGRRRNKLYELSEKGFEAIDEFYKRVLSRALQTKIMVVVIALLVFSITIVMARYIGTDYIPEFDSGDVSVQFEMETGTSASETAKVARRIETIMQEEIPEMQSEFTIVGQTEDGALTTVGFQEGKNIGSIVARMGRPHERERTAWEAATAVRERIGREIPEIERYTVNGGSLFSSALLGNQKPVEINISGHDFDELNRIAREMHRELDMHNAFVNVENTIDPGKAEYEVTVDKERASSFHVNTGMVAMQIREGLHGAEAGEFNEGGDAFDIQVRYQEGFRSSKKDLENMTIKTLSNQQVPVREIASIRETITPLEIQRENQQRVVKVMTDLQDISLGDATEKAASVVADVPLPEGVSIELGGQVTDQSESFDSLNLMFIAGILLVYMVMASQFESLVDPFIIIFAIPFSVIGVIWAFAVTNLTLSVVTFIGVIMLLGVVVNNGIVLVDYINQLRQRGYELTEAVREGGRARLRPVLMTSLTTMLGMLPMALSTGMGSEMWSPLGITIIGGLLVSTLITLILIPVTYVLFHFRASG